MKFQELGHGGMDLIDLARDKYRWRVLIAVVMSIRLP